MTRDPRQDPQPGDVVQRGQQVRHVTGMSPGKYGPFVVFWWHKPGTTHPNGWHRVHYVGLDTWRWSMTTATVLTPAEVPDAPK